MSDKRLRHAAALRAGDAENPLRSVSAPIVQSTIFELESAAAGAEFSGATAPTRFYTRWGNPTTRQAEAMLAVLEGGEAALVLASGMGAITTALISHLAAGDHIVAGNSLYSGTTELLTEVLPRLGIATTFVDQSDLDAVRAAMRDTTRVLYVETLTNPVLRLADLDGLAGIARDAGIAAMIDNTFATPANARPLEHGFDVVLHSLTKYLNGHTDVTGGAVIGRRDTIDRVWHHAKIFGPSISPFESWLLIRGLKTFGIRMRQHNENGLAVARFLEAQPQVTRVHHPGLESHPQHGLARRMLDGTGGMVAFELASGIEGGRRLVESVRLIKLAVSLGGTESLIIHPATCTHAMIPRERRLAGGITDGLIRLSVGIEPLADLLADLEQALAQV